MTAEDKTKLDYALRGKAWKVYWLLLKNGHPMSVREVQRALHFSSPSVANHHLEQLRELGLVEKQDIGGHYYLVSQVKITHLENGINIGDNSHRVNRALYIENVLYTLSNKKIKMNNLEDLTLLNEIELP